MRGKRRRLGMTVVRNSASSLSKAKAASASARKASIASSLCKKLAVSSTRNGGSATLPCGPRGLPAALACLVTGPRTTRLEVGDGDVGILGPPGSDVFQPAPGVVDQQQVDA